MLIPVILIILLTYLYTSTGSIFHQLGGSQAEAEAETDASTTAVVVSPFTGSMLVKGWIVDVTKPGQLVLCVFNRSDSGVFTIKAETPYQATKPGKQEINLTEHVVDSGDWYGFRSPTGLDIVKSVSDPESTSISGTVGAVGAVGVGGVVGVGAALSDIERVRGNKYLIQPITTRLFTAPDDGNPGSRQNPALSAQHILEFYHGNNLGTPTDGVYWIRHAYSKATASELYCNFSLRKGHGYMLVGSVGTGSWPNFDSTSLFSPSYQYGEYDKYGRSGNYYLKWSKFDKSAVSDEDPERCKCGGYHYNVEGKFCGTKSGKRLNVTGGLTEIMLATKNGKYWMVLDRDKIPDISTGKTIAPIAPIAPVASSNNFEGECSPNDSIYIKTKQGAGASGEPWINMGTSHACGNNYMFWGVNFPANEQFKDENGGIMVYVGGSYQSRKHKVRHSPSIHRAPGRDREQSTYREAVNVCRKLGKKICTKKQLEQAQDDGFGSASCGWTSTGPDKHNLFTMQPVSVDLWASDEVRECRVQPISSGKADIYCCDLFNVENLQYLDDEYKHADLWIAKLEQAFNKRYGDGIPVNAKFVVWSEDSHGLAVEKVDETYYRLVAHPKGAVPKALKTSIPCQLKGKDSSTVRATFITAHKELNIQSGSNWDGHVTQTVVNYGSKVKFYSSKYKKYLVTSKTPYSHISTPVPQVVAYDHASSDVWTIQPVDPDKESMNIANGDLVHLYDPHTDGLLVANIALSPVPGSAPQEVLVSTYSRPTSDCQWKVHVIADSSSGSGSSGMSYWYSNSTVRLQHVNTGKVLEITGALHKTKPTGGTMVNTVALGISYNQQSEWTTQVVHLGTGTNKIQQCSTYLKQIARARLLAQSAGPDRDVAVKTASELVDKFDRECYEIPQQAYNKTMWKLYSKIRKQLLLLTKETGLYQNYHEKETALHTNMKQQQQLMKQKEAELNKLRSQPCKPVKKCVEGSIKALELDRSCRELDPIIKEATQLGDVTDKLVKKIQDLKAGDINDYDIRTHKDMPKYTPNRDINSCPFKKIK